MQMAMVGLIPKATHPLSTTREEQNHLKELFILQKLVFKVESLQLISLRQIKSGLLLQSYIHLAIVLV